MHVDRVSQLAKLLVATPLLAREIKKVLIYEPVSRTSGPFWQSLMMVAPWLLRNWRPHIARSSVRCSITFLFLHIPPSQKGMLMRINSRALSKASIPLESVFTEQFRSRHDASLVGPQPD